MQFLEAETQKCNYLFGSFKRKDTRVPFCFDFQHLESRIFLPQQMLKLKIKWDKSIFPHLKKMSERIIRFYFYFGAMCNDMVWHAHRSHTKQSLIDGKTFQNATRLMFFVQVANELYFSVKMRDHFLPHVCILQQQLLALSVHPSVLLRLVISSCIILTKQPKKIETIDKPLITPVSFGTWIYHHYSGCYNPGSIVQCFFLVIVRIMILITQIRVLG